MTYTKEERERAAMSLVMKHVTKPELWDKDFWERKAQSFIGGRDVVLSSIAIDLQCDLDEAVRLLGRAEARLADLGDGPHTHRKPILDFLSHVKQAPPTPKGDSKE